LGRAGDSEDSFFKSDTLPPYPPSPRSAHQTLGQTLPSGSTPKAIEGTNSAVATHSRAAYPVITSNWFYETRSVVPICIPNASMIYLSSPPRGSAPQAIATPIVSSLPQGPSPSGPAARRFTHLEVQVSTPSLHTHPRPKCSLPGAKGEPRGGGSPARPPFQIPHMFRVIVFVHAVLSLTFRGHELRDPPSVPRDELPDPPCF